MPNHLANENSPYLLQHQHNPVEWYPWGTTALERAQKENKPIFLSIGYSACHWCHVMEHESFEDIATANLMNQYFINIKVDREERPDLDTIYMKAIVAMTGQGGWPMSVFLTPDGKPFFGGTYFPPVRRYNIPAFRDVLEHIHTLWVNEPERVQEATGKIVHYLQNELSFTYPETLDTLRISAEVCQSAAFGLSQTYDWKDGGWGKAPKFPQPMIIEFFLRLARRGDRMALDIASHALKKMAQGGMYDLVGGGFARYSVDNEWLIPHFEKMLYDNAQLALVYLYAYLLTKDQFFLKICTETFEFVLREMTHPQGGFFSSLDADSEGEEGKYYVWSREEILNAVENPQHVEIVISAFGITPTGNFEGMNVLQFKKSKKALQEQFSLSESEIENIFEELRKRLFALRAGRVRPQTDDKILMGWNSLMLLAFSEAARYLRNDRYKEAAIKNATFLIEQLIIEGQIVRSWRNGIAKHTGMLEDYAASITAFLSLYFTDPNPVWYQHAEQLTEKMIEQFLDPSGGFYNTPKSKDSLIVRPKVIQDNAVPSGGAMAASALLQMSALTGRGVWRDLAEKALKYSQDYLSHYPSAFAKWLCAYDLAIGPIQEVAIVLGSSESKSAYQALLETTWESYQPNLVMAVAFNGQSSVLPPLAQDRPSIDNQPTAYACKGFVCLEPTTDPKKLAEQLSDSA